MNYPLMSQNDTPHPNARNPLATANQPTPPGNNASAIPAPKKQAKRANINIATLNMNGLSAPRQNMTYMEKWSRVNRTLNEYKIAILALQETHLDEQVLDRINSCFDRKMTIVYSADPENPRARAGVAFVINKSLINPRKVSTHELLPGRALLLEIEWLESEKTRLTNIYGPNDRAKHPEFWKKIEEERTNRRLPKPDFLLGDFNVTEDAIDRAPAHLDDLAAIEALRDTRLTCEIQDTWRLTYPDEKAYTYRANSNGQQILSRLDRIYAARRKAAMLTEWKITQSPVPTDHWLVVVKYSPKDAPKIGNGRWSFPIHMLKNKELMKMIIDRGIKLQTDLELLQMNNTEREQTNPQRLWRDFKEYIKVVTKATMKTTHHKINSKITSLEKDHKETINHPDFLRNGELRRHEAYLANELGHLEQKRARDRKETLNATLAKHGEKLGGIWSALSKEKKPRDLIRRLKIPNSFPPKYERDSRRMANLARDFHENLQNDGLHNLPQEDLDLQTSIILDEIPEAQKMTEPLTSTLGSNLTESQTGKALHLAKNGTATGVDGCPYELWKALKEHHDTALRANKPGFNIIKVLTEVLTDIQSHGVDERTDFSMGWMCPIYKKKDTTDISNYRPITLLNTDYKLLTKALAIQIMDHISRLVHQDQAGFIPNRSIFDHIRFARAIINYSEITEENGAIIALDQEKAYDKIKHDYLWETLRAFNLPELFIKTIKALYRNAKTQVAINGFFSKPYQILRGIRQGDPLSCALFDLGIEPLACMIRNDPNIKGITISGIPDPIKANFFADDTNLYLSRTDSFDYVREFLKDWCQVAGAKFNIEKTEIIPIGSAEHREQVVTTRRVNPRDEIPLDNRIKIAKEGEAVRSLGAWIGNNTNDVTPWEPIIENAHKELDRWGKIRLTMYGRVIIVQAIVGGLTQFLTKAQGMPDHVENALTKAIRNFMWQDNSSPRIALDILQRPIEEGGLNLLDLKARNEAIEIIWMKSYLNLSPSRPRWAKIVDLIIDTSAPPTTIKNARDNAFLQSWKIPTRGRRTEHLNGDITRMLKVARKYNTNLAAIRLNPRLRAQLPAWYHLMADPRPITNTASKCLLNTHRITKVADLIQMSSRVREEGADAFHDPTPQCVCRDCIRDRLDGCRNPHACASEALTRIQRIAPKLNPLLPNDHHDDLSLTRHRKQRNEAARTNNGAILFDPSITSKSHLAECFRIFTKPNRISNIPAKRLQPQGAALRHQEVTIYTDGACFNNGKENAQCGSGIWIGPGHHQNKAIRLPGPDQSNQAGEIAAIILAANAAPPSSPLKIITDSRYVINGLTNHLKDWEDQGWINIRNAKLFKKAAYLLKRRPAPTTFQWTKGHDGDPGNEASDQLAKEGAARDTPDTLDLEIPKEYDLQGAKLMALTQAKAYRGILERKEPYRRHTTKNNLLIIRNAIAAFNGNHEKDSSLWTGLKDPALGIRPRQFLFKGIHGTPKVGKHWENVPGHEWKGICSTCHETETMEHILTRCNASAVTIIWDLAKRTWPFPDRPWPEASLGLILGCGSLNLPTPPQPDGDQRQATLATKGPTRLLKILMSESAYLIWVIRCERVIQGKPHQNEEIRTRWYNVINRRLTEDKILATKINPSSTQLVKDTWENVLRRTGDLPNRWMYNREFLVGRG